MKLVLDVDEMTLGELEELEALAGCTIEDIMQGERSVRSMIAIIFILRRRDNPAFTLEDAKRVKMSELELVDGADVEDPPVPSAAI